MADYRGSVNGIDVQATPGQTPRCQAFINVDILNYIQVETTSQSLQAALELACLKNVEVEVTYDDSTADNTLTRVRIIDRG